MKQRPSTNKKIMTHFIARLTLLWWSGTRPIISLRCACVSWKLAEDTRLLGQRQRILLFTAQQAVWTSCLCQFSWPPTSNWGDIAGPRWKLHVLLYVHIELRNLCLGNLLLYTKQWDCSLFPRATSPHPSRLLTAITILRNGPHKEHSWHTQQAT